MWHRSVPISSASIWRLFWHKWAQWPFLFASSPHTVLCRKMSLSLSLFFSVWVVRSTFLCRYFAILLIIIKHSSCVNSTLLSFYPSFNDFKHFSSCHAKNSHSCTKFTMFSMCLSCKYSKTREKKMLSAKWHV